jgi:tetratricopeptide (TPR) repeat protein
MREKDGMLERLFHLLRTGIRGPQTRISNHVDKFGYAGLEHGLEVPLPMLVGLVGSRVALEETIANNCERIRELSVWARECAPLKLAALETVEGIIRYMVGDLAGDVAQLEAAARILRDAAELWTPKSSPINHAFSNHKLAMTLFRLSDLVENRGYLEEAVNSLDRAQAYYTQAVNYYSKAKDIDVWGAILLDCADGMSMRGHVHKVEEYLKIAVSAYREALKIYGREHTPLVRAMIYERLGVALARIGDITADCVLLKEAMEIFQDALQLCSDGRTPELWATTQHSLGRTSRILGNLTRDVIHFEPAEAALRDALRVYTRDSAPMQCAMIERDLAWNLFNIGDLTRDPARLEQGIELYRQTLEVYTFELTPFCWANSRHDLGTTLSRLTDLDGDRSRLEETVTAFHDALNVYTREQFPDRWATIQGNLGVSLQFVGSSSGDMKLLGEAAAAFGESLRVFTPKTAPRSYLKSACRRGDVLLQMHAWTDAEAILESALNLAVPTIQTDIAVGQQRRLLRDCGDMGADLAYALIQQGRSVDALLAISRSRLLTNKELYAAEPLTPETISAALSDCCILVTLIVTDAGSAFLISQKGRLAPEVLMFDSLKKQLIYEFLVGRNRYEEDNWFSRYSYFRAGPATDMVAWSSVVRQTLEFFGNHLMKPLDRCLQKMGLSCATTEIVLIVPGFLVPIPLHAAPIDEERFFLDNWIVSYAPSPDVFMMCAARARAQEGIVPTLLAVTNPTQDLPLEMNPAWDSFAGRNRLDLCKDNATREAVLMAASGHSHLSFYCHGYWDQVNPEKSGLFMADWHLLSALDLRRLDMSNSRLAVLAACETALIDLKDSPEEFIGLPAVLIACGLPCVIASLWPVEALATKQLVERLFVLHLDGASPAAALRQAQIEMRLEGTDFGNHASTSRRSNYCDLVYWAAFATTGI